jgi:hypothetical protein
MYGQAFYNNYVTPCPGAAVTFLVLGIYDDAHGNQICMQRDVVGTAVTDADGKYSCEISVNVLQDAIAALNAQAPILGAGYHDVQFGILPCEASEVNSYPHSGNQYWFMSIPYAGGSYNTNVVVDVPAPVLSPTPTLSPTPVVEPDQKYYTSIWVLESGTYNNGNKQIADAIVTIRHNGVIIAVCNGGSGVMEYSTRSGSFEYTYDATAPGYKESTGSFNPVPGSTFVIDLEPV